MSFVPCRLTFALRPVRRASCEDQLTMEDDVTKKLKLSDLKAGDRITTDNSFTCMGAGIRTVQEDESGLYLLCEDGRHYLDGQQDEHGHLIGIS